MNSKFLSFVSIFLLFFIPYYAHADVVWPALLFAPRMVILAIPIGCILEFMVMKYYLGGSVVKVGIVTLLMNLISAFLGAILLLFVGLLWEMGPGLLLFKFFNVGTFNPITWLFTLLAAIALTTYIEYIVSKRLIKHSLRKPLLKAVLIANSASVTLAFISLFIFKPAF